MLVTFLVSKCDTSSVVSAVQPQNIPLMSVTFSVFRYSIPSMVVKSVQPKNHLQQLVGRALANDASKTTFSMVFAFDT